MDEHDPIFPAGYYYDLENQIWYEPLDGDLIRAGFTPTAMSLSGDVLVFTPKRIGRDFEKGRSFATIECGKWIGSARAAFDGVVVAHNEELMRRPELLNVAAFTEGWMLVVRANGAGWREGLTTGDGVRAAFDRWMASESYKNRTG